MTLNLRRWKEALLRETKVSAAVRQDFSSVIEAFLMAMEVQGKVAAVGTAKEYIEVMEAGLGGGLRWELGRAALRWLVGWSRAEGGRLDWRGRFEKRLREKQYAERTVETYCQWLVRFETWCAGRGVTLEEADGAVLRSFLDELALEGKVRVATQHQALNGVVRFYAEVLERPVEGLEGYLRARNSDRVPVVLSVDEVRRLLAQLEGAELLMGEMMYGGGLRLMELLRLRVKDVDVDRCQLCVRGGKGDKDRMTTLAERSVGSLREHLGQLRLLWEQDQRMKVAGVHVPEALGRKYPAAATSWEWQWLFDSHASSGVSRPAGFAALSLSRS